MTADAFVTITPNELMWLNALVHLRFASVAVLIGAIAWVLCTVLPSRNRTIRLLIAFALLAINLAAVVINVTIFGISPI